MDIASDHAECRFDAGDEKNDSEGFSKRSESAMMDAY
jgi:hypothetical protein